MGQERSGPGLARPSISCWSRWRSRFWGWCSGRTARRFATVFAHPLDLRLLGLGVLIFQCSLLITYVRWYLLVRVIEPRFTLRSTMLLGFIGYVFNLVIPGAVGGDFIKAAYLVRMHIKKTQAIASMVIDRILGLLGLFVLAAAGGSGGLERVDSSEVRKLIVAAWIATGAGVPGAGRDLHPGPHPPFPRTGRLWPWPAGGHHDRAEGDVHDLPAAARRRLRWAWSSRFSGMRSTSSRST